MLPSAGAGLVYTEKLPEDSHYFIKEALETALMTHAVAFNSRNIFTADIANAVIIFIGMT